MVISEKIFLEIWLLWCIFFTKILCTSSTGYFCSPSGENLSLKNPLICMYIIQFKCKQLSNKFIRSHNKKDLLQKKSILHEKLKKRQRKHRKFQGQGLVLIWLTPFTSTSFCQSIPLNQLSNFHHLKSSCRQTRNHTLITRKSQTVAITIT